MNPTIEKLKSRYKSLFQAVEFGIAGIVGFLFAEGILTGGVYIEFGTLTVPSNAYSSLTLIGLNAFGFLVGVTVAFVINEKITVNMKEVRNSKASKNAVVRFLKFQLVYLVGNVMTVVIQLFLLMSFSLAPSIGNIIGAIAAFPMTYFISMKLVWSVPALGKKNLPQPSNSSSRISFLFQ